MNQANTCVATIVIGDAYLRDFNRSCRSRLERYCARHGYDLKVLSSVIRNLPGKKLTWQKILLPELPWWQDYDQVCVMDSDVLVANDAPALPVIPAGQIGCVPDKLPDQINSGVLVYAPGRAVAECFAEALKDTDPLWDQRALSRVMRERGMETMIDPRFNRQVFLRCRSLPATLFKRHWLYHACADKSKARAIHYWLRLCGR
jgi:hypothetical protein